MSEEQAEAVMAVTPFLLVSLVAWRYPAVGAVIAGLRAYYLFHPERDPMRATLADMAD